MSRPPKPFVVLKNEKKSHRTKKELRIREEGEASLATGVALKESKSVKKNKEARKEFKRVNELLKKIKKNDAIYEQVINRYCLMQAECSELEERREYFYNLVTKLERALDNLEDDCSMEDLLRVSREIANLTNGMMQIDKILQSKRKMLLDIEKENIMTISSALRNIPKQDEKPANKLLEALNGK